MRLLFITLLLCIASIVMHGQVKDSLLRLLGEEPVVLIDPEKKTGKTALFLQNDSGSKLTLLLNAKNIYSTSSRNLVAGSVQFRKAGSAAWSPVYKSTLNPDSSLAVEIEITEFTPSGEAFTYIMNGRDTLTVVKILHGNIPFNVSLASKNPNEPEILLQRGISTSMVIKNEDAINYNLDWSLYVPEAGIYLQDSIVFCPGNNSVLISLEPGKAHFTNWFSGFFKDKEENGQLVLTYRSAGGVEYAWPSKAIQVKTSIRQYPDTWQLIFGNLILFVILMLGGVASAFLNIWMPNKLRRIEILKQLKKIAVKTHEISFNVYSGLRVGIRVNRLQLKEETGKIRAVYPDSGQTIESITKRMDLLEKRVELVRKLDNATQLFEDTKGEAFSAPAGRMDMIYEWLKEATEKLMLAMPDESHLNKAEENIKNTNDLLNNMTREDAQFAGKLAESLKTLAKAYTKLLGSPALGPFKDDISNLLSMVTDEGIVTKYSEAANVFPRHYHWLSSGIERLYVLRHYVNLWTEHPDRREAMERRLESFVKNLNSRTWYSLTALRQFRDEAAENIFHETVVKALENNEFKVEVSPTTRPKPNEKVSLEVEFFDIRINDCSAKKSIRCEWEFRNVGVERGWKIIHYFRNPEETECKVRFFKKSGERIMIDGSEEIDASIVKLLDEVKQRREGRYRIEIARFIIAFIIALIALFAGAKEQFFKLDLMPGLIAVFLLGYGADAIKNLVTKPKPGQNT